MPAPVVARCQAFLTLWLTFIAERVRSVSDCNALGEEPTSDTRAN